MTSCDLVSRAVEFQYPERIPLAQGELADMCCVNCGPARDFVPVKQGMNEWGYIRNSLNPDQGDQGQVIEHPLADWSNIAHFKFPDPYAPGRFDHLPREVERHKREGKFVYAGLGKGPMHLLDDLRGFEAYLMDIIENPERTNFLLDGIFHFLSGMVDRFSQLDVDAVWLTDDQAMQTGPLFSMDLWRQFFKHRYADLFRLAHDRGLKVFLHTCGDLSKHLDLLMEVGVDVIDNKQPSLWMHCPAAKWARGKITFSTCLDIQTTIHAINESEIERETHRLIRRLSVPAGGFIGTYYPKPDLQIPAEKTLRMLEAFKTFRWDS